MGSAWRPACVAAAAVLLLLLLAAPPCDSAPLTGGIIRTSGTEFVDDECREYNPRGWNSWPEPLLVDCMAAVDGDERAAEKVEAMFEDAEGAGFNTFRVFAHGVDDGAFRLQPKPGVYNETVFRSIDYLLQVASRHGIRAIISPSNNWAYADGKLMYVEWAGLDNPDDFWTDATARKLFRDHLAAMAARVNHLTGVAYRDDPAIFAWNLFNEFRCPSDFASPVGCVVTMVAWSEEMAGAVKDADPNHMVTLGAEGFFALGSGSEGAAPYGSVSAGNILAIGQTWSAFSGQDQLSQSRHVDYVTAHFWPNGWSTLDYSWGAAFLASQQVVAARLGKPLVVEEFGATAESWDAIPAEKDPWYTLLHNAVLRGQELGAPLQGALFWAWMPKPTEDNPRSHLHDTINVWTGDSTWGLVTEFTAQLAAASGKLVQGCALRPINGTSSGGGSLDDESGGSSLEDDSDSLVSESTFGA